MRVATFIGVLAIAGFCCLTAGASGEEAKIRVGAIDAVLTMPPDVEKPAGRAADRGLRIDRP